MKQLRTNKIKISIAIAVLTFCFLILPARAKAANISVTFGTGFPISETNIAPGQTFSRTFSVTNTSDSDQDLMINFTDQAGNWHTGTNDVENMISVQLQEPDGTIPAVMPNGKTSELLSDLYKYSQAFNFDTLLKTEKNIGYNYKLIFTFNPDAGNEYQNKKTVFDLSVGINAQESGSDNGGGGGGGHRHHHHNNGNGNGNGNRNGNNRPGGIINALFNRAGLVAGTGEVNGQNQPEVKGEATPEPGITEGASTTACQGWPKWIWIVVLLAYAAILLRYLGKNYKAEKLAWKFALVWTLAAVAFWYFFDHCREYQWFLYGIVIIVIASYFIYLRQMKKKIGKNMPGSGL